MSETNWIILKMYRSFSVRFLSEYHCWFIGRCNHMETFHLRKCVNISGRSASFKSSSTIGWIISFMHEVRTVIQDWDFLTSKSYVNITQTSRTVLLRGLDTHWTDLFRLGFKIFIKLQFQNNDTHLKLFWKTAYISKMQQSKLWMI